MTVVQERLVPLAAGGEFRIALVIATAFCAAGLAWLISSWGAYRDALGFGRARAIAATAIVVVTLAAALSMVGAIV